MSTQHSEVSMIDTAVGPLAVRRTGSGQPAFLWHSMFVDSDTFSPVVEELGRHRELFLVDGPGHGASPGPRRIYDLQDCAVAAVQLMDALELERPVDWVGNAWGGHVGILLADGWPSRLRTLTLIGTPAHPLPAGQLLKTRLLVQLFRLLGPSRMSGIVVDALVGREIGRPPGARSEAAESVRASFLRGDQRGKYWAMRSLMLRRPDLRSTLSRLTVPVLVLAGRDDALYEPAVAEQQAASVPQAAFRVVAGGGHVAPLFVSADEVTRAVLALWAAHADRA